MVGNDTSYIMSCNEQVLRTGVMRYLAVIHYRVTLVFGIDTSQIFGREVLIHADGIQLCYKREDFCRAS